MSTISKSQLTRTDSVQDNMKEVISFAEDNASALEEIAASMEELNNPAGFEKKLNALVKKSWRVFSKPPFSGPEEVVRYIGRYTHRVAISDSRILSLENGQVRFSYKDNKEKDPEKKYKEMTLSADEFIRRFLYHILPSGYHRIRNYGFLANGKKKQNIEIIKAQLTETESFEVPETEESVICPICEKGKMNTFLIVNGKRQVIKIDLTLISKTYRDTS